MLHRSVLLVIAGCVLTVAITLGARASFQRYHQTDLARTVDETKESLRRVEEVAVKLENRSISEAEARGSLLAAAASGLQALSPLRGAPRLRGSFLDSDESIVSVSAGLLAQNLEELVIVVHQHQTSSVVAERLDRVLRDAGPTWVSDPVSARRSHALWVFAYEDDVAHIHEELEDEVESFRQWQTAGFPGLAEANDWDAAERHVREAQARVREIGFRFAALPTPPDLVEASSRYEQSYLRLQVALESFGEYVAGRTAVTRPLRISDEALAEQERGRADARSTLNAQSQRVRADLRS